MRTLFHQNTRKKYFNIPNLNSGFNAGEQACFEGALLSARLCAITCSLDKRRDGILECSVVHGFGTNLYMTGKTDMSEKSQ
jgi:hypothetical protein